MGYQMAYPLAIEADRGEQAAFVRRTYAPCVRDHWHIALETAIFAGLRPFVRKPEFDHAACEASCRAKFHG